MLEHLEHRQKERGRDERGGRDAKKGTRRNDEILRHDKTSQAASQEYFFGGLDDDDDETSSGKVSSCSRVSSLSFLYATFIFSINLHVTFT